MDKQGVNQKVVMRVRMESAGQGAAGHTACSQKNLQMKPKQAIPSRRLIKKHSWKMNGQQTQFLPGTGGPGQTREWEPIGTGSLGAAGAGLLPNDKVMTRVPATSPWAESPCAQRLTRPRLEARPGPSAGGQAPCQPSGPPSQETIWWSRTTDPEPRLGFEF